MTDQEHNDEQNAAADNGPEIEQSAESATNESEQLSPEVEDLVNALAAAKEQTLRAQAEAQNSRRRAEQDIEKAHKFGQEKLVADMLPVVDNLERALAAIDREAEANKPICEGIELTLKSFLDGLARHQVVALNPVGEPFDPQLHQAMTMVDNPDVEPNTVIDVFQKGYTLHGRLVRPAMVVVAKG
ncbi:nucleotide exchange factor GrpE [Gilvimarinus polysaccharolyticus]|uniref:nucleotide exchange factor GrpE n=1 Tax=Gilvimarinus polysaccharolyticus TaxID=863921 RepID=UPI00067349A3|nr:nucleotide exchange factor GrpE [Gilvimarinus polysaccharolyticus]